MPDASENVIRVSPDGPIASISAARDAARKLDRAPGRPAVVILPGGRHRVGEPLKLTSEDSNVTYRSAEGQQAVIDAGMPVTGWQPATVNGDVAYWKADASAVMDEIGYFRQLFVNGRRATRSRLPKTDYYWIDDVPEMDFSQAHHAEGVQKHRFVAKEGHWQEFANIRDVNVVVMHWWHDDRRPVESYDPATRTVKLAEETFRPLVDDMDPRWARYYIDNVKEGLAEPGDWYLDRAEKCLYYVPQEGETPESVEAVAAGPAALLQIAGDPDAGEYVENVRFEGLSFEGSDWRMHSRAAQSNADLPGALSLVGARGVVFEDSAIRHVGNYALTIGDGCTDCRLVGCTIEDIGAGGVMIDGGNAKSPIARRTGEIAICDCHIHALGRVHHAGAGILMRNAYRGVITHNHIHDMFYTGISIGWVWGYGDTVSRDHRIEFNHLHDIGQGQLNDMGAIYLLGIQPGTAIRNNLIHDVNGFKYGGWGIYPDEGSGHVVIENNVIFDCKSQCFHLHYGRENEVRNNVWAFAHEGIVAISRGNETYLPEKHAIPDGRISNALTFERNIVITDGSPVFLGGMEKWIGDESGNLEVGNFISDLNCFFDVSGKDIWAANGGHLIEKEGYDREFSWREWLDLGNDRHSIVADPKCRSIADRDFTLAEDSPAFELGFKSIDLSTVGPRPAGQRGAPSVPADRRPNR